MSNLVDAAMKFLGTPNGQVRLLGSIMCIGPGYYIATNNGNTTPFVYIVMATGFLLVMISIAMAVVRAKHEDKDE